MRVILAGSRVCNCTTFFNLFFKVAAFETSIGLVTNTEFALHSFRLRGRLKRSPSGEGFSWVPCQRRNLIIYRHGAHTKLEIRVGVV